MGRLMLGILLTSGVIGIDTRYTMAYQIAGLVTALVAVSFLSGLFVRARFEVERFLPDFASDGETFEYRVSIRNVTKRRQAGLFIRERPDTGLPTFDAFIESHEPGEEKRNWFDRFVGYPRWEWLISRTQGVEVDDVALPIIPPQGEIAITLSLTPRRRGNIKLEGLTLIRPDPLGLVKTSIDVDLPEVLLAFPKRVRVPAFKLPGSRHHQPGGITQVSSVGDAEEFFSLRDYRPGDSLRRVHWRSWARTGEAVVKEFQEEYFVRYGLLLDTFALSRQTQIFEDAVVVAASCVTRTDSPDILLDLMFAGTRAYCFTSGRGLLPTARMLEILACVNPSRNQNFDSVRQMLAGRTTQMSGCICVLLSWDEPRRKLVQWLRANEVAVEVLLVTEGNQAIDPGPMRDRSHYFHFVESGNLEGAFPG